MQDVCYVMLLSGYQWNSDLAWSHNHMGQAFYITCCTALHLTIHLASIKCNVALSALRGCLYKLPWQLLFYWPAFYGQRQPRKKLQKKILTTPLEWYLCIGTAGLAIFGLCARTSVYQPPELLLWSSCTKRQHWLEAGSGPTRKNAAEYSSWSGKLVSCCFQNSGICLQKAVKELQLSAAGVVANYPL